MRSKHRQCSVIERDAGLCLTLISSASSFDDEGAARSGCSGGLPLPGELLALTLKREKLSRCRRCCTGLKLHGTHAVPHGCGRTRGFVSTFKCHGGEP